MHKMDTLFLSVCAGNANYEFFVTVAYTLLNC